MRELPVGGWLGVQAAAPDFAVHLRGWCRAQGHAYVSGDGQYLVWIVRGVGATGRWQQAARAGWAAARAPQAVHDARSLEAAELSTLHTRNFM